jgi:RNA polymerase sigma factor (sigma-70 family)
MDATDKLREIEGELAGRIVGGDTAAINELYHHLQPQIRARIRPVMARASAVAWLDAEDMEQEAYIVFRHLVARWLKLDDSRLPLGGFVVKWLPVYLAHHLRRLTHARAATREIPFDNGRVEEGRAVEESSPPCGVSRRSWVEAISVDDVEELVRAGRVQRVISHLPPLEQVIIILHHFHEWPVSKVADALSLPERGVRRTYRGGLEQVRRLLLGDEPAPPPVPAGCDPARIETFLRAAAANPQRKLPSGRECPALGLPSRFPRAVRPLLKRLGITRDELPNRPAYLAVTLAEALERLNSTNTPSPTLPL